MSGAANPHHHPTQAELALYAASDLGALRNWVVSRHVRSCEACGKEVAGFERAGLILAESAGEMPEDLHWGRLAGEMKANIRLGLEAGRIAGPAQEPSRPLGWRAAAAFASVALLTLSGWWLQFPRPVLDGGTVVAGQAVLKSTRSGIEVEENGSSLSLMHRGGERTTMTVSMQGELRARYIDDDTEGVTIHHVYAE